MAEPNQIRKDIKIGATVDIVLKKDQPTGKLTRGKVERILTNKSIHPRGIKVMLTDGQVGRVQHIISKEEAKREPKQSETYKSMKQFGKNDFDIDGFYNN